MTVNYTTLLGLAKPVSGTESGTWGDTVNNNLTDYLDSAIAGAQIISGTQTAVTLSKTTGASLSQAGPSGITGSSQYQIIRCTGNPASLLTITAPTTDKTYVIINATSPAQSVKIVGAGPTTGITILSGKTSLVAWNGTDFVEVSPNTISGTLPVANGGTGATTLTGVLKGNGTSAFTAASSGTDYSAGTSALATGILKSTTSTGALTIAVAGDFPTLNQNTTGTAATATNLASGSAGTIPYQSASGTTAMLAAGTSGQVLTSNGAAAPTWATASGGGTKTISNQTAAYTVVAGDLGKIINCTSGTFNVSLTAAASLGSGFTCTIWNNSSTATDVITIDPNAAETIDGVATLVLRRGEGLAVVCDGTNWQTDDKKPMRGYAENIVSTQARPIASGINAISISYNSTSSGNGSVAFGGYCNASGGSAVAIGNSAVSSNTGSVSIGYSSTANGQFGISIGGNTTAGTTGTAIGNNSALAGSVTATGAGAMALGGSYASGTDSFAAAIANNTSTYGATGANGVAIGLQSKSTTGISLGALAVSSGGYANSLGVSTTASGSNSTAIGSNNTASGQYAFAAGYKALSTEIGKYSYASGQFAAQGDAQHGQMVLRVATTNATPTALTSDGSAASTTNQVILSTYGSIAFSAIINAKSDSMGENAGFKLEGVLNRNSGVGSVRVVGTISKTVLGKDTGAALWDVNATADTTNGGLAITVTGEASTDIRWVASVTFVESNF